MFLCCLLTKTVRIWCRSRLSTRQHFIEKRCLLRIRTTPDFWIRVPTAVTRQPSHGSRHTKCVLQNWTSRRLLPHSRRGLTSGDQQQTFRHQHQYAYTQGMCGLESILVSSRSLLIFLSLLLSVGANLLTSWTSRSLSCAKCTTWSMLSCLLGCRLHRKNKNTKETKMFVMIMISRKSTAAVPPSP